jgi:YecR-like lipoprotein
MKRVYPFLAALTGLAACTTYKVWSESDSDQAQGTVTLSYEYRKFESPQVDERAGLSMARDHCADWGFKSAQRKGEDRVCTEGEARDCKKWRVLREYRCLKEPFK